MRHVAVILLWLATSAVAQEKPELDAGRAVAEAVARILATPRFEEQVEVRDTYQESLARYFVAAELSCGATDSGPPQPEELDRFRAHPTPPHADLLAGFKWLHQRIRHLTTPKKPRFFLYWVHLTDAPERFVYVVREGHISENDRAAAPGTEWDLLAGFADADKAAEALTRLNRRISAPSSPERPGGVTLWAARKCEG